MATATEFAFAAAAGMGPWYGFVTREEASEWLDGRPGVVAPVALVDKPLRVPPADASKHVIWVKWSVSQVAGGWVALCARRGREAADYTAGPITAVPCEIRRFGGSNRREDQELVWSNGVSA